MESFEKSFPQSTTQQDMKTKRELTTDDSHLSISDFKPIRYDQDGKGETLEIIDEETKNYIDDMKKGTYNILVAVRCRPLNQKEKEISPTETIKIMNRQVIVLLDPTNNLPGVSKNRSREQTMAFDYAFDKTVSQVDVFNNTTKFLIEGVVNGYNATVFAYGATGAGKTYTMLGTEEDPGIMPLTLSELFTRIKGYPDREYTIKLWYLEIYNENIKDLLSNTDEYLDLREDPAKGIVVSGIKEITATSSDHILNTLRKGNKNRTTEATNANETSSRSHAILQVSVTFKEKNSGIDYEIKYGKLSLIDLAGSERASATLNRGIRLIEGANINRSLLTLGNCINALCEANEKGTKPYVPYRDSKLTRLLKDSLGGNARTVMIANISPFGMTFDDTYNTLNYANRAKKIKTTIQRNVLNAQHHIKNYVNIINNLKAEIHDLKSQLVHKRDMTASPKPRHERDLDNENSVPKNTSSPSISFEKTVEEIRELCEAQFKLRQKISNEQIDLFNIINTIQKDQMYGNNEEEIADNKAKAKQMKKIWEKKKEKLKENQNTLEQYYKMISKSLLTNFQIDYIQMIIKTHKSKCAVVEYEYKHILSKQQYEKKEWFIKALENQIIIRDEIIQRRNITYDQFDQNEKNQYRTLHQIRYENNQKGTFSILNQGDTSVQLPPLTSNSNVNSIITDIREMNLNLNNKFKNIQGQANNHNLSNMRTKSEISIIQHQQLQLQQQQYQQQQRTKKMIARNHSNNIRNIYSANSNYSTPLNNASKNQIPKVNTITFTNNMNSNSNNSNIINNSIIQGNNNNNNEIPKQSGSSRILGEHKKKNIIKTGALSEHNSLNEQEQQSDDEMKYSNNDIRQNHFRSDKITEENENYYPNNNNKLLRDISYPRINIGNNQYLKQKEMASYLMSQPNKKKRIPFKL